MLGNGSKLCRPLKIEFAKETPEISVKEKQVFDEEISKLNPFTFDLNGSKFTIIYDFEFTMLDGKAINALTDTKSTSTCNVCNAKPSEITNLNLVRAKPVSLEYLKYGISILHCYIRTFEFILHISYKLKNKKIKACSERDKNDVKSKKSSCFFSVSR